MRPKLLLILFALILIATISVSLILYFNYKKQAVQHQIVYETPAIETIRNSMPKTTAMNIKLLFGSDERPVLMLEERQITTGEKLPEQCYDTIMELIKGPASEKLYPTIPQDTKVNSLFITEQGSVFIDFSNEIVTNHTGGTDEELLTVYSIVNTIMMNFPQIKKVQILINER
ncbi:MAG: hypothetical protein A2Y62_21165, partial [Candidatus Fischerbacteria bacterium RBG_13_37_8]